MFSTETQAFMEAAVDAVIVIDHRGRMTAVNEATQRLFGFETGELLGQNVNVLMPQPDRHAHDDYMRQYRDSGRAKIIGIGRQVHAQRKDGSLFPAHLSVGRVPDCNPPCFVGILRDMTAELENTDALRRERDRANASLELATLAQERVTRVGRLASMAEMASGMAHEINQPLTAITAYARACERYLATPAPDFAEMTEAVQEIAAEAARAGKIIERLRRLVRNDEPEDFATLSINDVVEELRALLEVDARVFASRIDFELGDPLPKIAGNPAQLQQLILNLVRNAFEALAESPAGTREVNLTTALADDGCIELAVRDTGPGFPEEISNRLFHPFATTKKSGTGLGLAISRTIAVQHGGIIGTRPVSPRGACVFIRLPAREKTA
jgi:two-component system sensor kinase FixL